MLSVWLFLDVRNAVSPKTHSYGTSNPALILTLTAPLSDRCNLSLQDWKTWVWKIERGVFEGIQTMPGGPCLTKSQQSPQLQPCQCSQHALCSPVAGKSNHFLQEQWRFSCLLTFSLNRHSLRIEHLPGGCHGKHTSSTYHILILLLTAITLYESACQREIFMKGN